MEVINLGTIVSVPTSTYIISKQLPIYAATDNAKVHVENGEYSLDGGDWTSAPGVMSPGQTIQLRVLSSADNLTTIVSRLYIGIEVGEYTVTTVEIDGIPDFFIQDYLSTVRSRVTEQFKNKPVFDKYLQLINTEADVIQQVLKDMMQRQWIDTAAGVQLDNIGDIVGQPRALFDSVIIYYFGFQGATGALSFGTRANPSVGGIFKSRTDPLRGTRSLTDNEYRALIKIKILKNVTNGAINDFVKMVQLLYDVTTVTYTEGGGVIEINIGRDFNDPALSYFKGLDEIELAHDYLPLPLGVRLEFDGTIL